MFKIITLGLMLLTSVVFSQEKKMWAKPFLNKQAPELVVEQWLNGNPNTEGKFILIDFWATWCRPCRAVIPDLNSFSKKFSNELVVIGLSKETASKVNAMANPKIEYYKAIDTQGRMYRQLEIAAIPHRIVIDPNGIVRWEGFPVLEGYELTEKVIKKIIDKYSN